MLAGWVFPLAAAPAEAWQASASAELPGALALGAALGRAGAAGLGGGASYTGFMTGVGSAFFTGTGAGAGLGAGAVFAGAAFFGGEAFLAGTGFLAGAGFFGEGCGFFAAGFLAGAFLGAGFLAMALGQNCFNFPEASNSSGALSRFLLMRGPRPQRPLTTEKVLKCRQNGQKPPARRLMSLSAGLRVSLASLNTRMNTM